MTAAEILHEPVEVTADKAGAYLRILDELVPNALHVTEQYATDEIVKGGSSRPGSCLIGAGRSRGQGWPEATRWAWPVIREMVFLLTVAP